MIAAPLRLPLYISAAIFAGVIAWWAWTTAEAGRKMVAVANTTGALNVVITLKFAPEAFHLNLAQDIGQVVKVEQTHLFLRSADRTLLRRYAAEFWVVSIEPWDGRS